MIILYTVSSILGGIIGLLFWPSIWGMWMGSMGMVIAVALWRCLRPEPSPFGPSPDGLGASRIGL